MSMPMVLRLFMSRRISRPWVMFFGVRRISSSSMPLQRSQVGDAGASNGQVLQRHALERFQVSDLGAGKKQPGELHALERLQIPDLCND